MSMTRPSAPPLLSELRSASSPASQVAALRALKNEIIGHEQKKEMWVGLGVLAPIARILNTHKGNGKRRHRDVDGGRAQSTQRGARREEEEARLQAIIIVGSLANGGPAFVPPICAGLLLSPLLSLLSPSESTPQLVLAVLRCLNAVADSLLLCHPNNDRHHEGLPEMLYTDRHLATITHILLQTSQSSTVQQQITLTAALVSKTCSEEYHRSMLAQAGVLEALAIRLSSLFVAAGNASKVGIYQGVSHRASDPSTSMLPSVLRAVSAIIQHSKSRAIQFLSAPAFASMFQRQYPQAATYDGRGSGWDSIASSKLAPDTGHLPPSPSPPMSSSRNPLGTVSNVPPFSALGSPRKHFQTPISSMSVIEVIQSQALEFIEQEESPLIGWLLYIARTESEVTSLTAAWVIAILYRQGLTRRGKETTFALLLVPTLSRMLDKDMKISSNAATTFDIGMSASHETFILEKAPAILAMLAAGSHEVQKAAADAGIIKKLSRLLKSSYNEIPLSSSAGMWAPEASVSEPMENRDDSSRLGPDGLSVAASYVMKLRESVLMALADMASDNDEYRKVIIENGVVPFIIRSLKPEDNNTSPIAQQSAHSAGPPSNAGRSITGNSKDVILAACGAARTLSRSVSILRTSLMDAGLTAPLFVLLKHQDMDLRVAATAVVTNLVTQFSPMQEVSTYVRQFRYGDVLIEGQAIIEAGVLKILCEHAHSINTKLRLNSVWALKHLVYQASNELKMSCLEELGPGWLKQIVSTDAEAPNPLVTQRGDREEGSATPIRMGTPNAVGEQVDLLNAVEEDSRESSQDVEDDGEEDLKMADSIGALSRAELDGKRNALPPYKGSERGPFSENIGLTNRNADRRPAYPGMSDELAIQKEGLDLLRNLLCGTGASEMIDFVLRELGHDKLFEMLAAKLRPKVYNAFNRERRSSENGVRYVQPQKEIVLSICYIIVHIAAGESRQRQLLIAQTELLSLILPLLDDPDPEVRVCCVWLCINLTWRDNADEVNCNARARELVKLGAYERLKQMENDPNSDVKERSKTAAHQIASLLQL